VLSAMLLGDRTGLSSDVRQAFIQTGTAHILAISGMHIGIIAFIFLVFLKAVRIPKRVRYVIAVFFLIFYCLLTGARPSVTRAVIMAIVVLAGLLLEREVNIYNSLGLSALVILAYNPYQLSDIGFQLSFISVLSIVYLSPRIEKLLHCHHIIVKSFSVSLSAWLGTCLIVLYYFKIFSPITVLANLVIVPLVSLVIVAGFIFLSSLLIMPFLTLFFANTAGLAVLILVKSAGLLSRAPAAYFYLK
ncbi:MAG: competence protein ComEC, partial [Candidatus Omnitrophica bacterium CG11_big_fil_rev_8_21_14_0_20_42_13]